MATVTLSAEALDKISRLIAETADGRETGGPLLGYERNGTIVIDVGGPGLRAL
jgi:hypothetical protein